MSHFTRRQILRSGLPAAIAAMFVPAWFRAGDHKLPRVVTASVAATDVGPSGAARDPNRINPNLASGSLDTLSSGAIVLRDALGLHVVKLASELVIERATDGPDYARVEDRALDAIRTGDLIDALGVPSEEGHLVATKLIVNPVFGTGGILTETYDGTRLMIRRARSWRRDHGFELEATEMRLDASAAVSALRSDGRYSPANTDELTRGRYVALLGLRAHDGMLVVTSLALGPDTAKGWE